MEIHVDGKNIPLGVALRVADRRTLAAVIVHLSGDPAVIKDPTDFDELVATGLEVITPYLTGEKEASFPSDEVLQAAMSTCAGVTVPERYRPMVRQQQRLAPPAEIPPLSADDDFSIAVIGGGLTGILAAHLLREYGVTNYTVYEKADEIGGTWRDNLYPGCRVDTPSILYSYWFQPDGSWPDHFSFQPALLKYLHSVADGLADHIQLSSEVTELRWDDEASVWHITVTTPQGTTTTSANVVIGAMGNLNLPKYPDIPGLESFAGKIVHSARWPEDLDLQDARVGIIGSGATANQIAPAIAPEVERLSLFQRSPCWVMSHPRYGQKLSGVERWLIESVPFYLNWLRFKESWQLGDPILDALRADPDWTRSDSVSAGNDAMRKTMTRYAVNELRSKPELIAKVVPTYPPHAKRMVLDNGWFRTLLRDDVDLITDPIVEITEKGIRTTAEEVLLDVIILTTGFVTGRVMWPIKISGRDGVDVRAQQDANPQGYMGISLPNCPNLYNTFGPRGIPAHGGNGALLAEMELRYSIECVRMALEQGWKAMEIKPDVLETFLTDSREVLKDYVWSTPGVNSWFKAGTDEPAVVLPRKLIDIWTEANHPDLDKYEQR